ncbi:acetyltransferase [Massilia sp. Root133]|uniref:GNAT family N-acetyltransferase n=1 Tax=Massilia cellulosiltytica TaxID=2683234 RepID=A0A7X3G3S6_9BURK|nr:MULTISPECIES: GNAT family N-acetyltransferase [Telluria group]KQY01348.1 acetyltransferase [Massilia sp. Root133]KQZ48437.1 acetyltransferase [Massilia sp. Root1485]MVW62429.1 GNAT family N-acetyltransferase [Telluria cellulosilytica]
MTDIRRARFPDDLDAVVAIFREYIGSTSVSLDFQDYEAELADLPGKYDAPTGGLFLAVHAGAVVGCAGFRAVDDETCEMKRVYVRPVARGQDLGRRLVERILDEGRAAGYRRICLDVLPEFEAARRLYASLGFVPAPPVTFNPVAGTRFLGMDL